MSEASEAGAGCAKPRVVRPEEGQSFWQPVPANGFAEVRIAHGCDASVRAFATGIQVIAPGSFVREHVHPAQDEILFFYRGTGEAWIDGTCHRLVPGTTVHVPPGHRHKFVATGSEPLEMMWVMIPGGPHGLDAFFARIGRPRTPGEPAPEPFPRPAEVAAIEAATVFAPLPRAE
ncbi:MAG: cupin domain-containing protein [Geminicoccaceae bacterium]|nr:cupin domain-containing protein [Geminicoccaceae bacterium]